MKPCIRNIPEKKLIGKSLKMSLFDDKTRILWQSFMPLKKYVKNTEGSELYSLQVYDEAFGLNPHMTFTKWALIEVSDFSSVPQELETFVLERGSYAAFLHKGPASDFQKTVQYIFNEWLPKSEYVLDDRPHFELLGKNYKNNDPTSEEEVWIPVRAICNAD